MKTQPKPPIYRGRFAPSPSGPLHFGSLIAATASYLDCKANNGKFIVRIEDLDPPREVKGSDLQIIKTLECYGFEWDEPIVYQSQRFEHYEQALDTLQQQNLIYRCQCTRKHLRANAAQGPLGTIYPNTCRHTNLTQANNRATRIKVNQDIIELNDPIFGSVKQNLITELGDFIIRRSDQWFAYQFAVVVDDGLQNISHIIRGRDLLNSTPRQIYLQKLLGLPTPQYLHLPLAINQDQTKLSKQTSATPISNTDIVPTLFQCLKFLGQSPPKALAHESLEQLWLWAIKHWQTKLIPNRDSLTPTTVINF